VRPIAGLASVPGSPEIKPGALAARVTDLPGSSVVYQIEGYAVRCAPQRQRPVDQDQVAGHQVGLHFPVDGQLEDRRMNQGIFHLLCKRIAAAVAFLGIRMARSDGILNHRN
jgi:hypothetical protein